MLRLPLQMLKDSSHKPKQGLSPQDQTALCNFLSLLKTVMNSYSEQMRHYHQNPQIILIIQMAFKSRSDSSTCTVVISSQSSLIAALSLHRMRNSVENDLFFFFFLNQKMVQYTGASSYSNDKRIYFLISYIKGDIWIYKWMELLVLQQ